MWKRCERAGVGRIAFVREVCAERTERDFSRIDYWVGALGKNRDFDLEQYKQSIRQRGASAFNAPP